MINIDDILKKINTEADKNFIYPFGPDVYFRAQNIRADSLMEKSNHDMIETEGPIPSKLVSLA